MRPLPTLCIYSPCVLCLPHNEMQYVPLHDSWFRQHPGNSTAVIVSAANASTKPGCMYVCGRPICY
jgi:hypothetical protein